MINVVRICSHNVMLVLAKMDPELASAVVASHFDAKWSRIQKKQMDGNCCVQIQIRQ